MKKMLSLALTLALLVTATGALSEALEMSDVPGMTASG